MQAENNTMKKFTAKDTFEALLRVPLDLSKVDEGSFEIEGVDNRDYPDFCDAFIGYAEFTTGKPLDEYELDQLNNNNDLIYEALMDQLY